MQNPESKSPLIVNFGGGKNSTWLLELFRQKEIRPDLIIFSNTGKELPETYHWVSTFSDIMQKWGFPGIVTVHATKAGKEYNIGEHCESTGLLPSLAYGRKSCSQKFKADPIEKFIRNWAPAKKAWSEGNKVTRTIGYHAKERYRSERRIDKDLSDAKFKWTYPLIEWGIDNNACSEGCLSNGWNVEKSACFFCPATKRSEILKLKHNHPELLAEALAIEDFAQKNHRKPIGLGGPGRFWRDIVKEDNDQIKLWDWIDKHDATPTPCGCYDE